jgi:hypothetical protein
MRITSFALAGMLATMPGIALAQAAPYKLVIMLSTGTAITDYPTLARV